VATEAQPQVGFDPWTTTVCSALWYPGAVALRTYLPAEPRIWQLVSQGTVEVSAPETSTDAPLTPTADVVEVTSTATAIAKGQGGERHSRLQDAREQASVMAMAIFGIVASGT